MPGRKALSLLALGIALVLILPACEDDPPVVPDKCDGVTEFTLLSPVGGETFTVGETVAVEWCIPDNWPYSQVRISLSLNGGRNYAELAPGPVNVPTNTFAWTVVDSEVTTQGLIKISDYDQTPGVQDVPDSMFTVVAP